MLPTVVSKLRYGLITGTQECVLSMEADSEFIAPFSLPQTFISSSPCY